MDENLEVIEDDDIIMPDEEVDTPTTEPEGEVTEGEKTNEPEENPQDEDKKFLDYLNKKGIKYNGENVEVKSFDDLVSTYQKGMNYDKVKEKADKEENTVMSYISEMASKMVLTPTKYIDQFKAYQKQKEEETQQAKIQELVDGHVPQEMAERIVKVEALADQLKAERAELQKQKEETDRKAKEEKEYEDFLKEYPEVTADKIPDEVFKEAKEIGLLSAYAKYENKLLKDKLKAYEQNTKNASSSVVVPTSEGSPTQPESKDAFLEGFDSID